MPTLADLSAEERAAWGRLQMFLERILRDMQEGETSDVSWMTANAEAAKGWIDTVLGEDPTKEFWVKLQTEVERLFLRRIKETLGPEDHAISAAITNTRQLLEFLEGFAHLLGEDLPPLEKEKTPEEGTEEEPGAEPNLEMSIKKLGLNPRVYNALRRSGIQQVGTVLERLARGDNKLLIIRNFGSKALAELKEKLVAHGFELPEAE